MGKGIDYGMGTANIDRETGIRFGVINLNSADGLTEWAWESFEADYGPATCGECGNEAVDYNSEKHSDYNNEDRCCDYACEHCKRVISSDNAFGDEAIGHNLDDGEYLATAYSDGDCFIIRSPYFTHAAFCSPCAPGACYLSSPCEDGERAYCFGHDWFTDGIAPYPVYCVADGSRVYPTTPGSSGKGNTP